MKTRTFERGQTLPIVAMAVLILVAFGGFAADVGYHQYMQRAQQTATDSAALAAAAELATGNSALAGQRDASSNGFTAGAGGVTLVSIGSPGAPDPYAGDPHAVQAQISATYATVFENVFGISSVPVTTKAVAISDAPSNWCIVALQTSGTTNIDAHSVINAPNCDISINNSHLSIGGQSSITTSDPIEYAGTLTGAGTSTFSPGAPVQALPASDPCRQIASCLNLQQNPPSSTPCQTFNASAIVANRIYCDMNFGNGTFTLPQGWYVIPAGGHFNANNATLYGSNVTIIDFATNNINATNAVFHLSAPESGDYAGMLFYAPNYTQTVAMNSGDGGLQGIIYAPKASLTLNAGATAMMMVIAGQLTLNAANTTFTPLTSAQITHPRLVE